MRSKGKLRLKWADSLNDTVDDNDDMEVSDDDSSSVGGQLGMQWRCD